MGLPDAILLRRVSAIHRPVWVFKAWLMGRHLQPTSCHSRQAGDNHPQTNLMAWVCPLPQGGSHYDEQMCGGDMGEKEKQNEEVKMVRE